MRVAKIRREFDVDIDYRHFPLHPETPQAGLTLAELFAGRNIDPVAAQSQLAHLMAQEGLPFGNRTMTYNSRLAQELGKWAETQSGHQSIHDALFEAYFVDNLNLAEVENLIAVAERVGLCVTEAKRVLDSRQQQSAVDADWDRSRQLGITSVPTFVVGDRGLVGAQPYEQLAALLTAAGAPRRDT